MIEGPLQVEVYVRVNSKNLQTHGVRFGAQSDYDMFTHRLHSGSFCGATMEPMGNL